MIADGSRQDLTGASKLPQLQSRRAQWPVLTPTPMQSSPKREVARSGAARPEGWKGDSVGNDHMLWSEQIDMKGRKVGVECCGWGLRIGSSNGFSIPTCEGSPRVWTRTRVTEMRDSTKRQSQQDAPSDRNRKKRASHVSCEPSEPSEPSEPLEPCSKISLSGSSTSSGSSSSFLIRLRPSAIRPNM